MIKWPITYTDYNGETHTEDFYFNLNKAEVMSMNLEANGSYAQYLERIVEQRNGKEMSHTYRTIILKAYGEKSPDGRRFIKSKELTDAFEQSEAYVELYMELATKEGAAQKFMAGIFPNMEASDATPDMEKHMSLV